MLTTFAKYISYIFEPFTFSFLTLILVINSLNLGLSDKLFWLSISVAVMGLPPVVIYLYELKIGKIKDWFMTNRAERRDVQLAWFFGALVFVLLAWSLQAPQLLLALGVIFFSLSLLMSAITFFWKISVHMMGVSLFVVMAIFAYSFDFIWLVSLIFLVGWARIKLGAHTLSQVCLGAILTFLTAYIVLNLFFPAFGLVNFRFS